MRLNYIFLTKKPVKIFFFSKKGTKMACTHFAGKKIMVGNDWPLKNEIKIDVKININERVIYKDYLGMFLSDNAEVLALFWCFAQRRYWLGSSQCGITHSLFSNSRKYKCIIKFFFKRLSTTIQPGGG